MQRITLVTLCCSALLSTAAFAQDTKSDAIKDNTSAATPKTMQECRDYTATVRSDATKKDAKKDAACAELIHKEGSAAMKNDGSSMMKSDGMAPKK